MGLVGLVGCATVGGERGPDGTVAYYIKIEASEPGARIEVNQDYVGEAPVTIKVFGDPDGTFHNFGSTEFIVRAIPVSTNLHPQTKLFRTGGWFSQEDRIPSALYFDMRHEGFRIDAPRY